MTNHIDADVEPLHTAKGHGKGKGQQEDDADEDSEDREEDQEKAPQRQCGRMFEGRHGLHIVELLERAE